MTMKWVGRCFLVVVTAGLAACTVSSESGSSGSTPTAHCPSEDGGVAAGGARCSYSCTCYNYGTCNFMGALCSNGGTCADPQTLCLEVCGGSEQVAGYTQGHDCRAGSSSSMPSVQGSSAGTSTGGASASN